MSVKILEDQHCQMDTGIIYNYFAYTCLLYTSIYLIMYNLSY